MVRTRIAPSPTGSPHIGTIFQAMVDYVLARQNDGAFVLRIEDTDQARRIEGAEEEILDYLEYFGLSPDESPRAGGDFGPYRQSERLELYKKYAKTLVDQGDAYFCFCSSERLDQVRKDLQKQGKPPMYDKHCRAIMPDESASRAKHEPYVIRMKIPSDETIVLHDEVRGDIRFDSAVVDDQVILKTDGYPTYHLGVVVDDHLMKITHVVRGEEWISSAPKHVLLYRYFGWELPKFIHTPLLRNPDKSKLSKRHSHTSAQWYRDQGYLPETVLNFLITRVWNHPDGAEIFDLHEVIEHFSVEAMHIQGPIVDLDKLNWLNGQRIRALTDIELWSRLQPFMHVSMTEEFGLKVLPLVKERLVTLSKIDTLVHYFVDAPTVDDDQLTKQSKMTAEETHSYLMSVVKSLENLDVWNAAELEKNLRALQEKLEMKPRVAFMTLRVALTGETMTPPLFDVMEVLGREEVLSRLTP